MLISERTKAALAAKKVQGIKLGNPRAAASILLSLTLLHLADRAAEYERNGISATPRGGDNSPYPSSIS